ncbi:hypothetical protein OIV83_001325 [Microbotryomycetes sp. JL201]|nr:hypothetical protein OIV83_001325 [Microbotryomycetes sp. JL201]
MSQTKISIPQDGYPGQPIIGILQRTADSSKLAASSGSSAGRDRKIALIIHGVLAHKDQIYHKRLANALADRGLDSFRYDLRGQGGESEGAWGMMNIDDDVRDLQRVIEYLGQEGYRIHLLVAHSRGSLLSTYYLSCFDHPHVLFVNLSGRYDMTKILRDQRYVDLRRGNEYIEGKTIQWKTRVAGADLERPIDAAGLRSFAEWDNAYLQSSFDQSIHVLTVHGTADKIVPVQDAHTYHRILSQRSPGTHTLSLVEGAGHNFVKPFDEPVKSILRWLDIVDRGRPSGGKL